MKKKMEYEVMQDVIIFLAVALILLAIMVVYLAYHGNKANDIYRDMRVHISQLQDDNKELLEDKRNLIRQNDEMLSYNQNLTAEVKEMREMIKKLTEPVQEESKVQASESNETTLSSQSESTMQTDATKLKERLPEGHTNVFSGMPLTSITNKQSEQWKLQCDTNTFTGEYGIRCYNDREQTYYLSAMGSAYGRTIGDTFKVTLRCGTVFYVMLGEFKDDGTVPNFFGHPTTHADGYDVTCVLEFIYDAEHINSKALQAGNFCNIECFGGLHGYGGDIVKIEYLGRKWKP